MAPDNPIKHLSLSSIRSFVVEPGDDSVEFIEGEALVGASLLVDVGTVHHLEDFVVIKVFVEPLADGLELLEVDDSVLVDVEKGEDASDSVLGLGLSDSGADHVEELVEVNRTVDVSQGVNKAQDEGVSLVEAEFLENLIDFGGVDGATSVFVENIESILQFFVVLCGEAVLPAEGGCGLALGGCLRLGLGCSAHGMCQAQQINLIPLAQDTTQSMTSIKLNSVFLLQHHNDLNLPPSPTAATEDPLGSQQQIQTIKAQPHPHPQINTKPALKLTAAITICGFQQHHQMNPFCLVGFQNFGLRISHQMSFKRSSMSMKSFEEGCGDSSEEYSSYLLLISSQA